jgi:hypothetical protein
MRALDGAMLHVMNDATNGAEDSGADIQREN